MITTWADLWASSWWICRYEDLQVAGCSEAAFLPSVNDEGIFFSDPAVQKNGDASMMSLDAYNCI